MLPKKYRITYSEFHKNKHPSVKLASSFLSVFVKRSSTSNPRFVIVVGKSVDKRSSRRHTVKRLIVEGIRAVLGKINRSLDILIKAKKIIRKDEIELLKKEINKLLQ